MDQVLTVAVVAGGYATVLIGFVWLARRVRRRRLGGAVMGPLDEIYHPAAHRLRPEIEAHEERMVPLPSPDDQLRRRGVQIVEDCDPPGGGFPRSGGPVP